MYHLCIQNPHSHVLRLAHGGGGGGGVGGSSGGGGVGVTLYGW